MTLKQFRERYRDIPDKEELTILASRFDDIEDQIFVFFVELDDRKESISNAILSTYYERMKGEGVSRSILVLPSKLGAHGEMLLQSYREGSAHAVSIETFHEVELLVNITEHILVPSHHLLTATEKQELL